MGWMLAVVSLLLWLGVDATRKVIGRSVSPRDLALALAVLQLPFFSVGLIPFGIPSVPSSYWAPAFGTIAFNLIGNVLFLNALQLAPYSQVMPFMAFTPVFTALGAWAVVHQRPSLIAALGIGCVTIGALWLTSAGSGWRRIGRLDRGSAYMLATAFSWSWCAVFDKRAADTIPGFVGIAWHLWFLTVGISAGYVLVSLRLLPDFGAIRRQLPWLLIVTVGFVGGLVTQMAAYLYIPVATVETVKRAGSLGAAVFIGSLAFREADTMRRLPPVALMAVGVAATVLGQ